MPAPGEAVRRLLLMHKEGSMRTLQLFGLATVALIVALSVACGDGDQAEDTPPAADTQATQPPSATQQPTSPTPSAVPSPPQGLYPSDKRTGDVAIDRLLQAFADRDPAVGELVAGTEIPCGTGVDEPPCEGSPEGTSREVVPTGGCQPLFVPVEEAASSLSTLATGGAYFLYAVYSEPDEFGPPPADSTIVFATALDGDAIRVMLGENGGVVRFNSTCGNPPSSGSLLPGDAGVILGPATS